MHDTLLSWAQTIAKLPLSVFLQNQSWWIPVSQSVHILFVSVVFGSALILSLRLLGVGRSGRPISELATDLVPWIYGGVAGLTVTGILQTFAEPVREFVTPPFWWKMLMIVVVVTATALFLRSVRRHPERWDSYANRPGIGRAFAVVSLLLWIAIIFCGRFIGYTWILYV